MEKTKTHWRKVFKSDHLGVADLEEFIEEKKSLIFTILQVKSEIGVAVAGRKGNHNIAYFKEGIKPMVLNATNSKTVKSFCNKSPFVDDWQNVRVELYIKNGVKAVAGGTTDGVYIKVAQPKDVVKPTFTEANFEPALKSGASIEQIKIHYQLDSATEKKFLEYGTAK
tara:strand:+ start:229 stop:732 length:504 start_codon:yes stop_codon:yes gene_type:complete